MFFHTDTAKLTRNENCKDKWKAKKCKKKKKKGHCKKKKVAKKCKKTCEKCTPIPCPGATIPNGDGNCVCPSNTIDYGNGNCSCPGDTVIDGVGHCSCPGDTVNDGLGACYCPENTMNDGDGNCFPINGKESKQQIVTKVIFRSKKYWFWFSKVSSKDMAWDMKVFLPAPPKLQKFW